MANRRKVYPEEVIIASDKFVTYKQSLGFKYEDHEQKRIKRMLYYLYENEPNHNLSNLTKELVDGFLECFFNCKPRTIHISQSLIRQYGLYLKLNGFDNTYVFPNELIKCSKSFVPYIYSEDEIVKIFKTIDSLSNKRMFFKELIDEYSTIIKILYCCGTRIGETIELKKDDIDLQNGIITIMNGKNNVSRMIPISESLLKVLMNYCLLYPNNDNVYLFPSKNNKHVSSCSVRSIFKDCLIIAGFNKLSTGHYPRIHDLRHTFAVHSLENAINNGLDPYCCLPTLSVYMGHKGIESTEYYLRLTKHYYINVLHHTKEQAEAIFPGVELND